VKSSSVARVLIFSFLAVCQVTFVLAQDLAMPPEEFAQRRAAVLEQMPDSSVAIFHAALLKTRSNDVEYEYRQKNSLFYLTGITDQNVALVLVKGGVDIDSVKSSEVLFVPRRNSRMASFLGKTISTERAKNELGFEVVKGYGNFGKLLGKFLTGRKELLYSFPVESLYDAVSNQRYFIAQKAKKSFKAKFNGLTIKSPNKILSGLRQIKSPAELRLLQKAIDITGEAHLAAMRAAKPEMYEYQLEAIIEYVFKFSGAEYPAFPSIVGSGPNSTILHHWKNRRQLAKGDLVVVDIGAEVQGYSADVTRTIPANGKFSKEQREIYEIVLRAQKEAIAAVKPGVPFRDVHKVAKKIIKEAGYAKYFNHSTSHYLGLDTHDVGDRGPLQPGMVITVEPGIYISEGTEIDKAYWNIGVRIEDDVLVTEDGYQLLSHKAPREIADIEKIMKEESKLFSILD